MFRPSVAPSTSSAVVLSPQTDELHATSSHPVVSCLKTKYYKGKNIPSKKYIELEKIYDEWLYLHNESKKSLEWEQRRQKFKEKHNKIHFNNQVRAPYLLVYKKKKK